MPGSVASGTSCTLKNWLNSNIWVTQLEKLRIVLGTKIYVCNFEQRIQWNKISKMETNYHYHHHNHYYYHHHHHYHLANIRLEHLLIRSSLTRPKVSLILNPGHFRLLVCGFLKLSFKISRAILWHFAKNFFFLRD